MGMITVMGAKTMLDDFMVRAVLAGFGLVLATAPLGCFVVWRRMAYFGDATAHAALLGVAISLFLSVSVFVAVLAVALAIGAGLGVLTRRWLAEDSILGVLSHTALAAGLCAVALLPAGQVDLHAYLFGDILAVSRGDLAAVWAGAAVVGLLIVAYWPRLLTATLSPDLAAATGDRPQFARMVLGVALALTVALSIKIVGALLISAMLVVPAAAARSVARNPESMAQIAVLIGWISVVTGLALSWYFDLPGGPAIVLSAGALFAVGQFLRRAA